MATAAVFSSGLLSVARAQRATRFARVPAAVRRPDQRTGASASRAVVIKATAASTGGGSNGAADESAPVAAPQQPTRRLGVRAVALSAAACVALSLALPAAADAAAAAAAETGLAGAVHAAVSFVLHLDKHLAAIIATHGPGGTYATLFAIVFAETGLVLTPFLPGDSLLFAAGAFAALGSLSLLPLLATFFVAAVLGDAANYAAGAYFGRRALDSNLIKRDHVARTERFYARHGGKTVVLARFVPIVRTFAPFVAGVGTMPYPEFAAYNVGGAALWTLLFTGAGFFFGNLPFVRANFTLVVLAIVAVSVLPVAVELYAASKEPGIGGGTPVPPGITP